MASQENIQSKLGRRVEYDERSKDYPVRPLLLSRAEERHKSHLTPRSYRWRIDEWLDQRQEGACVAFAHGHKVVGRTDPHIGEFSFDELVKLYHEAQLIDPWPETSPNGEEGTSVLAGAKTFQKHGYYSQYRWILGHDEGLKDAILTLGYLGGLVMGSWWWSDMFDTNQHGYVTPTGFRAGGHAWYAYGVKVRDANNRYTKNFDNVDLDKSVVYCRNSWGRSWGLGGDFKLTLRHWNELRLDQGEAMWAVETRDW